MKSCFTLGIGFLTLLLINSCVNPPDYPLEPEISFVSMSKTSMVQGGQFQDTMQIVISFTDGDGDLGGQEEIDLKFQDLRTGEISTTFSLPDIPNPNQKYGIDGEIIATIYSVCCIHPTFNENCDTWSDFPEDELVYSITLTDRAGNVSNTILTDPIRIICN